MRRKFTPQCVWHRNGLKWPFGQRLEQILVVCAARRHLKVCFHPPVFMRFLNLLIKKKPEWTSCKFWGKNKISEKKIFRLAKVGKVGVSIKTK